MASKIKVDALETADGTGTIALNNRLSGTGITGHVLQVVQGSTNTGVTTSSTSHGDTGLSATITPTSTSSKILVTVTQKLNAANNIRNAGADVKLLRGSTTILDQGNGSGYGAFYRDINISGTTNIDSGAIVAFSYIDSPSTTSATTYKTTGRSQLTGNPILFQSYGGYSTITLMEIAG